MNLIDSKGKLTLMRNGGYTPKAKASVLITFLTSVVFDHFSIFLPQTIPNPLSRNDQEHFSMYFHSNHIKMHKLVHKKSSQLIRVFTSESHPYIIRAIGGMAEWSKAPVLKTGNR